METGKKEREGKRGKGGRNEATGAIGKNREKR
jgi:hypothetical protein